MKVTFWLAATSGGAWVVLGGSTCPDSGVASLVMVYDI
jgi:hypothetical protein